MENKDFKLFGATNNRARDLANQDSGLGTETLFDQEETSLNTNKAIADPHSKLDLGRKYGKKSKVELPTLKLSRGNSDADELLRKYGFDEKGDLL